MENKSEEAYKEIMKVLKKHEDIIVFDVDGLEEKSKLHLYGIELKEKYGFNLDPKDIYSIGWQEFGSYLTIGSWGEKYKRTISYPDDGSQPKNKQLLQISFPTGAYIFGDDYPKELFKEFFGELKTYKPDFLDTINRSLYFSLKNGSDVFNDFNSILQRYNDVNKVDRRKRDIKKMKSEIKRLEVENTEIK